MSRTYKNYAGQTIELFEGPKGYVTFNQATKEISVHYKDSDSMHSASNLESAIKMIN